MRTDELSCCAIATVRFVVYLSFELDLFALMNNITSQYMQLCDVLFFFRKLMYKTSKIALKFSWSWAMGHFQWFSDTSMKKSAPALLAAGTCRSVNALLNESWYPILRWDVLWYICACGGIRRENGFHLRSLLFFDGDIPSKKDICLLEVTAVRAYSRLPFIVCRLLEIATDAYLSRIISWDPTP